MRAILKHIAPRAFMDGLERCNETGLSLVARRDCRSMLDVGCGDGELTMKFAEASGAGELYGIEFVDEFRKKAESRGIRCSKEDLNGRWGYSDDSFDLILSSQNIEHLHNTRLYLEECHRCLKVGGQLIVLTENLASWVNIGALVFGWQPFSTTNINGLSVGNPLIWHKDEPRDSAFFENWQATGVSGTVGHVRVLAFKGLRDMMEEAGFRNIIMRTTGWLPLWGKASDILCAIDRRHGHFLIGTGFKKSDLWSGSRRVERTSDVKGEIPHDGP